MYFEVSERPESRTGISLERWQDKTQVLDLEMKVRKAFQIKGDSVKFSEHSVTANFYQWTVALYFENKK